MTVDEHLRRLGHVSRLSPNTEEPERYASVLSASQNWIEGFKTFIIAFGTVCLNNSLVFSLMPFLSCMIYIVIQSIKTSQCKDRSDTNHSANLLWPHLNQQGLKRRPERIVIKFAYVELSNRAINKANAVTRRTQAFLLATISKLKEPNHN